MLYVSLNIIVSKNLTISFKHLRNIRLFFATDFGDTFSLKMCTDVNKHIKYGGSLACSQSGAKELAIVLFSKHRGEVCKCYWEPSCTRWSSCMYSSASYILVSSFQKTQSYNLIIRKYLSIVLVKQMHAIKSKNNHLNQSFHSFRHNL